MVFYCGQAVAVTEEVAMFLEESDRQLYNSDRRYGRRNFPLSYVDSETLPDSKRCTGRNDLMNIAIWNLERERIRGFVRTLGPEWERLYYMRYVLDVTQQRIADELDISKMAVSKRLKKLQGWIDAQFFPLAQPEREQSCSVFSPFLLHVLKNRLWQFCRTRSELYYQALRPVAAVHHHPR